MNRLTTENEFQEFETEMREGNHKNKSIYELKRKDWRENDG